MERMQKPAGRPANKPLVWLPFAAGGLIAALLLPVIVLAVLLLALGIADSPLVDYDHLQSVMKNPASRVFCFILLTSVIWHAAHRTRMTLQDLVVRRPAARRLNARLLYLGATAATAALALALLRF